MFVRTPGSAAENGTFQMKLGVNAHSQISTGGSRQIGRGWGDTSKGPYICKEIACTAPHPGPRMRNSRRTFGIKRDIVSELRNCELTWPPRRRNGSWCKALLRPTEASPAFGISKSKPFWGPKQNVIWEWGGEGVYRR